MERMLGEMRAMAVAARGAPETAAAADSGGPEFITLLRNALREVNALQQSAAETARAFELGQPGVGLPDVMLSLQKAGIAFQAMTQVRNRLVSAYQEIMSMQV